MPFLQVHPNLQAWSKGYSLQKSLQTNVSPFLNSYSIWFVLVLKESSYYSYFGKILMNYDSIHHQTWSNNNKRDKIYEHIFQWRRYCCCCCLVAQSCLTPCNPMDCGPPGSSVHGISQARILEWMAISFSRGSSRPRDGTHVFWQDYLPLSHQGSYVIRNGRERYKFKICPMMCYTQLTIQFLQIGFNGWPKIRGDDL